MNNVVRLSDRKQFELIVSKPGRIATAVANILVANAELEHAVKELSKRFDAIENAIASIEDGQTRIRLELSAKLSRETLSSAMVHLTKAIGALVDCCART